MPKSPTSCAWFVRNPPGVHGTGKRRWKQVDLWRHGSSNRPVWSTLLDPTTTWSAPALRSGRWGGINGLPQADVTWRWWPLMYTRCWNSNHYTLTTRCDTRCSKNDMMADSYADRSSTGVSERTTLRRSAGCWSQTIPMFHGPYL